MPARRPRYTPVPLPDEFEAALDARPDDWLLRLVAADWLDEHDDPLGAECLRWQAGKGRRPDRSARYKPEGEWAWWVLFKPRPWDPDPPKVRELPEPLWDRLPPKVNYFSGFREYPTRREAELALRAAWGSLTPRQRETVRNWPEHPPKPPPPPAEAPPPKKGGRPPRAGRRPKSGGG